MKVHNNLKRLLEELGIKSMIPTETLLKKLGGMTLIRFNKILNNSTAGDLTALEADRLTKWLAEATGRHTTAIILFDTAKEEEPAC